MHRQICRGGKVTRDTRRFRLTNFEFETEMSRPTAAVRPKQCDWLSQATVVVIRTMRATPLLVVLTTSRGCVFAAEPGLKRQLSTSNMKYTWAGTSQEERSVRTHKDMCRSCIYTGRSSPAKASSTSYTIHSISLFFANFHYSIQSYLLSYTVSIQRCGLSTFSIALPPWATNRSHPPDELKCRRQGVPCDACTHTFRHVRCLI